jgi:alpha-L-fucosidase 2
LADSVFFCAPLSCCLLPNFFTLHNDYRCMGITVESMGDENFAPVQLDAIMGCVNAVQEMLLRVAPKRVYLLPACPGQWVRGSTRLSIFDGYIDLSWDLEKKTCRAVVCAQRQLDLTVVMPWSREERQICLQQGENTVLEM